MNNFDIQWMELALVQAQLAQATGEVPVGAVLIKDQQIIAASHNQPIALFDPSAHAEIMALRKAGRQLNNYRLLNTTLYVTLEPCVMCMGALIQARVARIVYGAKDPKAGAICSVFQLGNEPRLNHDILCEGGVLAESCAGILTAFFRSKR